MSPKRIGASVNEEFHGGGDGEKALKRVAFPDSLKGECHPPRFTS
jgi:hypothetical protein